jgi:dihydroflavonol-4-reductase
VSRLFVTGGTGFIGGALVTRLVGAGHEVRALARTGEGRRSVHARGAEPIAGDLSSTDELRDAMAGCRWVFHVAGVNEMCSRRPLDMFTTNVTGTANVVAAAAATGVERVVYTSSAVVLGESRGVVADEEANHRGRYLSTYERSKHEAEQIAFSTAASADVELVAVNPSSVQGPGRTGGSARLLLYALRSRRPWLLDTALSVVDIDDCVAAHVLAAERGAPGARYVISGATVTVAEAVRRIGEVAGREIRPRLVPAPLVRAVGMPLAFFAQYLPTPVPLCPEMLAVLLHGHRYDGGKAVRDLGLVYTPFDETLRRTVSWYRDEGLIDGSR